MILRLLLVLLLLFSGLARAESGGIQLYENGDYEAAVKQLIRELIDAQHPPREREQLRVYLAAALHAQGQVDEAQRELERLVHDNPELRLDTVRFPPDLVALAEALRQRVQTEREYARREAERERKAREEARLRLPPPEAYLRPEAVGVYEFLGGQATAGAGLSFHRGLLETGARVLLTRDSSTLPPALLPHLQLHGGVLLGSGTVRPHVGPRLLLIPGARSYGAGLMVGARFALPARFVALVDVGADYFFITPDDSYRRLALTIQAGLGFDVRLPSGT